MCGFDQKGIVDMIAGWNGDDELSRGTQIKEFLAQQGTEFTQPHIEINIRTTIHHAMPEPGRLRHMAYRRKSGSPPGDSSNRDAADPDAPVGPDAPSIVP